MYEVGSNVQAVLYDLTDAYERYTLALSGGE